MDKQGEFDAFYNGAVLNETGGLVPKTKVDAISLSATKPQQKRSC